MYLIEMGYKDGSCISVALERIAVQVLMSLSSLLLYQRRKCLDLQGSLYSISQMKYNCLHIQLFVAIYWNCPRSVSGDGAQRTAISADEDVFINLQEREARRVGTSRPANMQLALQVSLGAKLSLYFARGIVMSRNM
jgi:hypothetical protein